MTKQVFARGVSKAVPIIGAVTSGGVTYATFRPLSSRLQKYLKKLPIADPEFYKDMDNYEFDEYCRQNEPLVHTFEPPNADEKATMCGVVSHSAI